jgi:hypothetical protein
MFVLLDYNSQDGLAEWVRKECGWMIARGELVYYRFTEPGPFRMAHAKNLAHRLGMREGADVLVNLDADNFVGEGFAAYVRETFHANPNIFMWSGLTKAAVPRLPRGVSGRIAVTRSDFTKVGGYDEKYTAWSPDDKDFTARLVKLGLKQQKIEPKYLRAINHGDKVRFRDYPEAQPAEYDYDEPEIVVERMVVNAGRVGTGVVYRNFRPEPIEVDPLPSRIFGVGMHKTGTQSLSEALRILGFDSAHWEGPGWAKRLWLEMREGGPSQIVDGLHAVTDLPLALFYDRLDQAYPGSKFVLTVRGEGTWLQSVRDHWSEVNPWRTTWDSDPFTHRCHSMLYGQRHFDADVMLQRYRRHNAEVQSYFRTRGRSRDLLVMDMEAGDDWYALCGFLKLPIPKVGFPRMNKTR